MEAEDEILIKDRYELEGLLVNFEAAVRVRKRCDFFSWVQGVFQGLIAHDLLICALARPGARSYSMEWMSSHPVDAQTLSQLCSLSDGLVYRLMSLWEARGKQPLMIGTQQAGSPLESMIVEEMARLFLYHVAAHGVPDLQGNACTFFCFATFRGDVDKAVAARLRLVVPYLHCGWMRAVSESGQQEPVNPIQVREALTLREIEILRWLEQGKSNAEIARILEISHLTVKNHVQRILRKLVVQNRTQAAARSIELKLTRRSTASPARATRLGAT